MIENSIKFPANIMECATDKLPADHGLRHFRLDMLQTAYISTGLINTEPTNFGPHCDASKRQVAFGRWAIPKIRKELLHRNVTISRQALIALLDFSHDPEKVQEIIDLNVLARLVRMLISEDDFTRYHTLLVMKVLATQPNGAKAIIDKNILMINLKQVTYDDNPRIRRQAAFTIEALGRSVFAITGLIEKEFDQTLILRIRLEEEADILLSLFCAMDVLMGNSEAATKRAIEDDLCESIAVHLSHKNAELRLATLRLLTHMFMYHSGKLAAQNCTVDIISALTELLDDKNEDILEEAALDLSFLFITTKSKLRGAELKTDHKLLPLINNTNRYPLRINAIQALTNLTVAPEVKGRLLKEVDRLQDINTNEDPVVFESITRLIKEIQK